MGVSGNTLSTALSALQAAQRSLSVTSQNIANANVEGYARQRTELMTREPAYVGSQPIGTGVDVVGVSRQQNQFLDTQVLIYSTATQMSDAYATMASQMDQLLSDKKLSIDSSIQKFFSSAQNVADNPSFLPGRQVMLSEAQIMVDRFRTLDDQINSIHTSLNGELDSYTKDLSSLATSVADLNHAISVSGSANSSFPPNDLLNQRDALVRKMSEYVSVQTVALDNGGINVMVGQGQALVLGETSFQLSTMNNSLDPTMKDIAYATKNGTINISSQLSGGKLGGLLDFRDNLLLPTQNQLGRVAIGIADTVNQQHRNGMDLNGDYGNVFFAITNASAKVIPDSANTGSAVLGVNVTGSNGVTSTKGYELSFNGAAYSLRNLDDNTSQAIPGFPYTVPGAGLDLNLTSGAMAAGDRFEILSQAPRARVLADTGNTGAASVSATVTNVSQLTGAEYDLTYNGTNYIMRDTTDGSTLTIPGATPFPYDVPGKGFQLYISGLPAAKDHFVIQPSRLGAQSIQLALTRPDEIAAASPIRTSADVQNLGNASITPATITDQGRSGFANPMRVVVSGVSPDLYDLVDVNSNTSVLTNQAYNATGTTISYNGWQASISGAVQLNDKFDIQFNTNGVGDNTNARALADLQGAKTMNNGQASFQSAYGTVVSEVGSKNRQAKSASEAQTALLNRAVAMRENESGVNLDEEAANLLRFQQAYQAASKVLTVSNEMFQTLLAAFR